jgi:hypothetical protein
MGAGGCFPGGKVAGAINSLPHKPSWHSA